jgi:hypothetical protein
MFLGNDMCAYILETVLPAFLEYEIYKRASAAVMRWRLDPVGDFESR